MYRFISFLLILFFPCLVFCASDDEINKILNEHYATYKDKEYFSGIALSVYIPKEKIKNYFVGLEGHENNSKKIDENTLFEIGSITKSFTAAIVLQLEKEKKLKLEDTLQHWLPDYSKWSHLTLTSLLNMTSGLPNYSDAPLMNAAQYNDPKRQWFAKDLIDFVYPKNEFSPPLKSGYYYSNTGYILTEMIIEKVTKNNFQHEIENRLFKPANLTNTFYPIPNLSMDAYNRLAHGYGYNQYSDPELVGKDLKTDSLSWAAAAGAVISNSDDVIKWVKALFVEDVILDKQQKITLTKMISTATGKPISQTSEKEPRAFALGVSQGYDKDMGQYWYYEGQTEGFRALYMYSPKTGIIIVSIFNSAVNGENDHAGELMKKIFQVVRNKK